MARLGPDNRPGFRRVECVEGYSHWAATYDADTNPLIMLEETITLELIGPIQGQLVLDLGCGTGRYCLLLAERGASVVGLDPSRAMLERAREKASGVGHIELHNCTIEKAEFPDDHFDAVISALTLSHLPGLEPTLGEMVRVLKHGGWMIISDIHPYWAVSGHDYTEFFDQNGQEYRIPQYAHLVEDYWRLLSKLGMRVEEIREPRIDSWLVEKMPSLEGYQGIPLAMVLKARKALSLPQQ